jgi:nucleoside-diphosphate-sugar epimerase
MKVLLIGATGVIGSQIVPFLKAEFELHLAAMSANAAGPDAPVASEVEGLAVEHCDIRDFPSLCKYLEGRGFDAVINCAIAPYNGVDYSDGESLHEYSYACLDINGRGAYNVLEAAWRARVGKVVYISSLTAVLGQPEYASSSATRPSGPTVCTRLPRCWASTQAASSPSAATRSTQTSR